MLVPVEDSGVRTKCEFGRRNVQRATCGVGTDLDVCQHGSQSQWVHAKGQNVSMCFLLSSTKPFYV